MKKFVLVSVISAVLGGLMAARGASAMPPPPGWGPSSSPCEQCVNDECRATLNPSGGGAACFQTASGCVLGSTCVPQAPGGGHACEGFLC